MAREVTHRGDVQIVSAARLRDILVADGEACFCAPDASVEWDAGPCPMHDAASEDDTEHG